MRLILPLLFLWGFSVFAADNLIPDGGFEVPVVKERTLKDKGGDPTNAGKGPGWIAFSFRPAGKQDKVTGGLTNEVARNGSQSLFIRFNHANGAFQGATLVSNFIPVVSGTEYEVSIWGRTDPNDLINAGGRSAYVKLEVDYFARDGNQSVGEPFFAVEPIPGSKGRDPNFVSNAWRRFYTRLTTPPGAVFAQVTWRWETGSDPGQINGIMYFDDAAMTGPAAANPAMTPSPVEEQTPAPPSQ